MKEKFGGNGTWSIAIGASVQYTELAGVDHDGATSAAYSRADLIEWMLRQRRR